MMASAPTPDESVPDLRHPHAMTLSDKSVVKISIAQAFIVCGLVASGAVAWYAEKTAREAHEKNTHVHFEESFERDHGAPVGKFDLGSRDEQYTRALEALQSQVKRIEENDARAAQHQQDSKPRWHP